MTRARDLASLGDNTTKLEQQGLVQVIASSVTKGASGSASVDSKGNVTFSGTESIALNSVFNSTYQNYLMVFNGTTSAAELVNFRMRLGATDATGANYQRAGAYRVTNEAIGGLGAINQTSAFMPVLTGTGTNKYFTVNILNPFEAKPTIIYGKGADCQAGASFSMIDISAQHDLSNSYDGIILYPGSGTITGTARVYGYNQ